jgi:hypothetical protein
MGQAVALKYGGAERARPRHAPKLDGLDADAGQPVDLCGRQSGATDADPPQ